MNDKEADKLPSPNEPKVPHYIFEDAPVRDEFLTQNGISDDESRKLFSFLCDKWDSNLSYANFLSKAENQFDKAKNVLDKLMAQLKKNHSGIVSRIIDEDKIIKDRIILTEKNSSYFWYWFIESLWQKALISDKEVFPTASSLLVYPEFPKGKLQELNLMEISHGFIKINQFDTTLYSLIPPRKNPLIVTIPAISIMLRKSKYIIRKTILNNSILQSIFLRELNTVMSNFQNNIIGDNNDFWLELCSAIIQNKNDLIARKTNIPNTFFTSAQIQIHYIQNEIKEEERVSIEKKIEKKIIQSILGNIHAKTPPLITHSEFNALFIPYKERWPNLKVDFTKECIEDSEQVRFPLVIDLGNHYIHRDHVYPLFKEQLKRASNYLRTLYLDMFIQLFNTGNKKKFTILNAPTNFKKDIKKRVTEKFPILNHMLENPRLVADGIIHHGAKILKITDAKRIRKILEYYFNSGTIKFKKLEEIFNCHLYELCETSFAKIGIIKQIFLRLIGRYESYLKVYKRPKKQREKKKEITNRFKKLFTENKKKYTTKKKGKNKLRLRNNSKEQNSHIYQRESLGKKGAENTDLPQTKKEFTLKKQEDIWDEFRDIYKNQKKK